MATAIIKKASLSVDGVAYKVRNAPLFPGLEATELLDASWGVRQDQYIGGRTRYPQMSFEVAVESCPSLSSVGCQVSANYQVQYAIGDWCNTSSTISCCYNMADALLVSITPGTADITSEDIPTYTITLRPNSVSAGV